MSDPFSHPMIIKESWEKFTEQDHKTWNILFKRQSELLKKYAAPEFIKGIETLEMEQQKIPKFSDLNRLLKSTTGFTLIPVSGLVPEDLFFKMLAQRCFPSTCFIRKPEHLDFTEEPDIVHDVFGHIPLLSNPIFADFMELFGKMGLESIDQGLLRFYGAFYWYTVEFGLIQRQDGMKLYGAGIASSKGETLHAMESSEVKRRKFTLRDIIQTPYQTNALQGNYFVIESFQELFDTLNDLNLDEVEMLMKEKE